MFSSQKREVCSIRKIAVHVVSHVLRYVPIDWLKSEIGHKKVSGPPDNNILKGRVQKNKKKLWKIPYKVLTPPLPPLLWKKNLNFFSETRPFFENFL